MWRELATCSWKAHSIMISSSCAAEGWLIKLEESERGSEALWHNMRKIFLVFTRWLLVLWKVISVWLLPTVTPCKWSANTIMSSYQEHSYTELLELDLLALCRTNQIKRSGRKDDFKNEFIHFSLLSTYLFFFFCHRSKTNKRRLNRFTHFKSPTNTN